MNKKENNLLTDKWEKKPKKIDGIVSPSYVLNYSKSIAKRYIKKIVDDIDQTKRDSIDFIMLREYIKNLDKEDLKKYHQKRYLENKDKINEKRQEKAKNIISD